MIHAGRFSELFDAHAASLALFARQWLDRADAEDVVQEVFIRLLAQIREPANVKAWLFTAVRNEAISRRRSRERRQRREQESGRDAWFESGSSDALDVVAATEALRDLPEGQREIVMLRIWGELTLKEIAAIVGSSTSTVFDQYRAALGAIREKMGVSCPTKNH